MNAAEGVAHYRTAFSFADETLRIELVRSLRDIAIQRLEPLLVKLPRPLSDSVRESCLAKGIVTKWNLKSADDAMEFFLLAKCADVSVSTKSAADLLAVCTQVIEMPSRFSQMENWILDSYAGLEHDNIAYGQNHRGIQKARAKKPRGKLGVGELTVQGVIAKLALKPEFQELSAKQLWTHFQSKLDSLGLFVREVANEKVPENPSYQYERARDGIGTISLKHFENSVSKTRKNAALKISDQPG